MAGYLPLLTMVILAAGFAMISFLASGLLGPKRPNAVKSGPYESGIVPRSEPVRRFPVRFYLVAMIFIIFDIEIIFTYPWAVIYSRDLGRYGLVEMAVFVLVVFVAFLYLVSNGALDWGPVSRAAPPVAASEERTTASTVRRVTHAASRPGEPVGAGVGTGAGATAGGNDTGGGG